MTPTDDTALWRTIADQLRADIADEVYQPGSPLPGEILMADRYHTSRPTVRRAIAELAGEGLLTAAHGRGTYVRPRPDRRAILINAQSHRDLFEDDDPRLTGWTREPHPDAAHFHANGYTGTDDAIITPANRDQAETLRISTGTMIIYRFAYWRHTHTHRAIAVTSISPAHLLGIFHDDDHDAPDPDDPRDAHYFAHASDPDGHQFDEPDPLDQPDIDQDTHGATPAQLYPTLTHRHGPVTFTTTVTARMPQGDELNTLGMDTGTPLLQITRTMNDPHGRPLEATTIEAPADRFHATSTPHHTTRPILEL